MSGQRRMKRRSGEKKKYVPYGTLSREVICELLESQKEKRGVKGAESLFMEIMASDFSNLERDLTVHEFMRLLGHQKKKKSIQKHISQETSKMKKSFILSAK